jgi:hypothetical protein
MFVSVQVDMTIDRFEVVGGLVSVASTLQLNGSRVVGWLREGW